MPTLEEVMIALGTPANQIATLILAVVGGLLLMFIIIIFSKSKNAVFTFTKKRSEKQRAMRQQRVKLMRRDEKWLHAYMSAVNTNFLVAVVFLVITVVAFVTAFAGVGYISLFMLVLGMLCMMISLYFVSVGIDMQKDVGEALPDISGDDEAPL